MPGEDEDTQCDHHDAATDFQFVQVTPEPAVESQEAIDEECSQEKWQGQTHRVYPQ